MIRTKIWIAAALLAGTTGIAMAAGQGTTEQDFARSRAQCTDQTYSAPQASSNKPREKYQANEQDQAALRAQCTDASPPSTSASRGASASPEGKPLEDHEYQRSINTDRAPAGK